MKKNKRCLSTILIIILLIVGVNACSKKEVAPSSDTTSTSNHDSSNSDSDTSTSNHDYPNLDSDTTQVNENDGVSIEKKNALSKAQSYSDMFHMSKQGLYEQLTSTAGEQFDKDAAEYAIENVKADWNANALAKAKEYQKDMNMSKKEIYDQLTSKAGEKFTASEAQYAIDNLPN